MSQLEALIAIGIFFIVLLIAISVVLIFAIRDQRIENQQHHLKLNVIIDNLIDMVANQNYGNEDKQE